VLAFLHGARFARVMVPMSVEAQSPGGEVESTDLGVPYVGRQRQMRELRAAVERAARFDAPQFVTVVGGAGSGKTRFIEEWLRETKQASVFRAVRAQAPRRESERRVETVGPQRERFRLLGNFLKSRFELPKASADQRDSDDAALDAVRDALRVTLGDRRVAEVAAFMAPFMGLNSPSTPVFGALQHDLEKAESVSVAILGRFLEEDARSTPLVVILEDIDGADDESLDILQQLAVSLAEAPLVLVATARPELYLRQPGWGRWAGSHVTIEMDSLEAPEVRRLTSHLVGRGELSADESERLVNSGEGNPGALLALAENLRTGQASTYWTRDGMHVVGMTRALDDLEPRERISRLSAAHRDLLARGAAFGPFFWTGGVVALGRLSGSPPDRTTVFAPDRSTLGIESALLELRDAGVVVESPESSIPGQREWVFSHQSDRAMLASSVDPELQRRRSLFAAQWLQSRAGGQSVKPLFERLAALYEKGGDARRAGLNFVAAGDQEFEQGHLDDARRLYTRGNAAFGLSDSVEKLSVLHKLGDVASRMGNHRDALAHFATLLEVAWRLDLPAKGGVAHARIGRLHRALGHYKVAARHLELGRALFEQAGDRLGMAACLDDVGRVKMLVGQLEDATQSHRQALRIRAALGDDRGKALTLSWLGLCEIQRGDLRAAARCFSASLELAKILDDTRAGAFALIDLAAVERELGRLDRARALLTDAAAYVGELSEPMAEAHLAVQLGECLLRQESFESAETEFSSACKLARRFGVQRLVSQALRGAAESRLATGDAQTARAWAEEALATAEAIHVPILAGAALRVIAQAEMRVATGNSNNGEPRKILDRALELLSNHGFELEVLKSLDAYAAFELESGRPSAAKALRGQALEIRARAWPPESQGAPEGLLTPAQMPGPMGNA